MIEPYVSLDKPTYDRLSELAREYSSNNNQIINLLIKEFIKLHKINEMRDLQEEDRD